MSSDSKGQTYALLRRPHSRNLVYAYRTELPSIAAPRHMGHRLLGREPEEFTRAEGGEVGGLRYESATVTIGIDFEEECATRGVRT